MRNIASKLGFESEGDIANRVMSLTDGKDYGNCPPSMNAQVAVNELARHLLGSGWYSDFVNNEQVNTEIVYEIERKYRRIK